MIFGTAGGLGLFLYGMVLMSEGLRKAAGQKLKKILETTTKRTFFGFLVGAGVTAIIQASGATTVIVIGLVNAGLLTLRQAIGVIIGSNVGTTATAWLVSISGLSAFDVTTYALPVVGVGFLMQLVGRTRKVRSFGEVLLGFGILFLGIGFMKDAFGPLERSQRVQELFVVVGSRPLMALLIGMGLTILLQSSSAAIAIVQLLAMGGGFGTNWEAALNVAIPFVLGANIGTTITAQLAAIQANRVAKRAAWAHTMFNVFGSVIAFPFVYIGWYRALVQLIAPWELDGSTVAATIAVAHTIFNVASSFIFLPLARVLEKTAMVLVPERASEAAMRPVVLERHLLGTPIIALDQARREIVRMTTVARRAVNEALEGLEKGDVKKLELTLVTEDIVDNFQYEITTYLTMLSKRELSDEVSVQLPVLLHTVNDLERVGDHAVNISEIARRKIGQKLSFSDNAQTEAAQLKVEINQMFEYISTALENNDTETAKSALVNEANLNKMQRDFRRNHVQRMTEGKCLPETGLIFIDLVDNVEKIGDHLTNIAQAVIGGLQWDGIEAKRIWPKT